MLKRITTALIAAILLLSLCSCTEPPEEDAGDNTQTSAQVQALDGKYLDAAAAAILGNKEALITYEGTEYYTADYQGSHLLACDAGGGRVKILFEYAADTKLEYLTETYERSGKKLLYFTKSEGGEKYASLCAYYLPTLSEITIAGAPCSNFVALDVPASYEMYSYGFIATGTVINVIDLTEGSVSARYSQSIEQLSNYIELPDSFFDSDSRSTILSQESRTHLRVTIMQGEKETRAFLFNCALGVATEAEK